MKKKLLQNRIAENSLTFPFSAFYAAGVWLLSGVMQNGWWVQLLCLALIIYCVVELNTNNALLRVRSRMIGASFLVLSCLDCSLFQSVSPLVATLLTIASFHILFSCYQQPESHGKAYTAFLMLGTGSLFYVQLLWLIPVLWVLMITQLQMMSWRNWLASLLGLATPYWLGLLYAMYLYDISIYQQHFTKLITLTPLADASSVGPGQIFAFAFVLLLLLIGCVHMINKGYEDRIRVRQLFAFFAFFALACAGFMLLQPTHYALFMPLFVLSTSPFVAHLFTFTKTRLTNIVFISVLVLSLFITIFNLFIKDTAPVISAIQMLWNALLNF